LFIKRNESRCGCNFYEYPYVANRIYSTEPKQAKSSSRKLSASVVTGEGAASRKVNVNKLSPLQEQVLDLLSKGLTEARIAEQLAISPDSLTDLVCATCKELQLANRVELLLYAYSERNSKKIS